MSVEQEIRNVNEERLSAVMAGDLSKLESILAADLVSVSPGGMVLGKAQMMADLTSGDFKVQSFAADDYRISVYGDSAVVVFRNAMSHSYKGTVRVGQYRVTSVYVKRQGRWMLVAQHVTQMPQPSPPA